MEDELLAESTIDSYAIRVADGSAKPEEAEELLADFVRRCDRNAPIPEMLLRHFADCLRSFLSGYRVLLASGTSKPGATATIETLDKAFGLSRPFKGAPPIELDIYKEVAMQVLEKRIAGRSLEKAWGEIADARRKASLPLSSDSQIRAAWAKYKLDGYLWLRANRSDNANPWSAAELARLTEIFSNEPWWRPQFIL
jgi:hypothetical protein